MRELKFRPALVALALVSLAAGCGGQDSDTPDAGGDGGETGFPAVDPSRSTLDATSPVAADGEARSTVTVTALDAEGSPVAGATVHLSSDRGALDTIAQPPVTGPEGVAIGFVSSTTEGTAVLSAEVGGVALAATASLAFGPACTPATETCNGVDDDCDGEIDEDLMPVAGQCDTQGVCAAARIVCDTAGTATCVYGDAFAADEGLDHCDQLDNDCDGQTDEGCPCADGETRPCGVALGLCTTGLEVCADGAWGVCSGVLPVAETCDGRDEDCDGLVDEDFDADGDGATTCGTLPGGGGVDPAYVDCDDGNPLVFPGAIEACNGMDDDCDGLTDEGADAACDDGLFCNGVERCEGGCVSDGPPTCDDGVDCTADACDPILDACIATASDAFCDDGSYCNGAETCDRLLGCRGGAPPNCDDGIDCTTDRCSDAMGCVHAPDHAQCWDGRVCTLDVCDGAAGCTNPPDEGATCVQGACTGTCSGALCGGCACTVPGDCDDGIACTVESCDAQGACIVMPEDGACSDGDACTHDRCDPLAGCAFAPRQIDVASAFSATSSCLTLGTGAPAVVALDLRDSQGQRLLGAAVDFQIAGSGASWVEPATQASAAEPGVYWRTVVAPASGSSLEITASVQACGQAASIGPLRINLAAPVAFAAGGTGGCTPQDGHLRVQVVTAETGQPIPGAFVMIGEVERPAFHTGLEGLLAGSAANSLNTALTDANGYASFVDLGAELSGAQMITAGAEGRAYLTLAQVPASDVVLPLRVSSPVRQEVTLDGDVGPSYTQSNLRLEAALVSPVLDLEFLAGFELTNLFEDDKPVSLSGLICSRQSLSVPGNVHLPAQSEAGCNVSASPADWLLTPRSGAGIDVSALQGSADLMTLSGATTPAALIQSMRFERVGLLSGVSTAADQSGLTIPLTHALDANMPVTVANAPLGDLFVLAAGDLDGQDGTGRLYLQGMASQSSVSAMNVNLTTNAATGVFTGKRDLVFAIDVAEAGGASVVLDRRTLGRTTPRTLDSFFAVPAVTLTGRTYGWGDPTTAHSPPGYDLAQTVLRRSTPDGTYQTYDEPFWVVLSPSGSLGFTLPTLPPQAPRYATEGFLVPDALAGQSVRWYLGLMHLGLAPGGVDLARFELGAEARWLTHLAAGNARLQ